MQPVGGVSTSASSHTDDSTAVKMACYILIGVGAFSMLLGFLGCVGAIYEVRCLLGLVSPQLRGGFLSAQMIVRNVCRCDSCVYASPSTSPASCSSSWLRSPPAPSSTSRRKR